MKKWVIAGATSILIMLILVFNLAVNANASMNTPSQPLLMKSICIENNDSLWSIASSTYCEYFGSMDHYINQIKEINNLQSDTLHTGNYIIIPYYSAS